MSIATEQISNLTKLEEHVLLAVVKTAPESYGIRIAGECPHAAIGSIYVVLARLESRGILSATTLPPQSRKGGRRRKAYTITDTGVRAVKQAMREAVIFANAASAEVVRIYPDRIGQERTDEP